MEKNPNKQINMTQSRRCCPTEVKYMSTFSFTLSTSSRIFINPFQANVPFLYPLKTSENLTFSGGIEREHWPEMGLAVLYFGI